MRRAIVLGAIGLTLGLWISPSLADTTPEVQVEDLPLSATFVTEGTLPATELEAGFSFTKADADRTYRLDLSAEYAWGRLLGLKLSVPVALIEPRGHGGPTVAGVGDMSVLAKSAPLVSREHLFALGGGLKLTLPTGSEDRGLGGEWAVAPGLLVGKAWRVGDRIAGVQADAFYSWQLDDPDREERFTANATTALTLSSWLTGLLELNSVRVVEGDPALRGHWQAYVTPGLSARPADGWDIRAGLQMPLTGVREFDYSVILIVTKGF